MDWIDLADDRDGWQAFLNAVKNIRLPSHAGDFLTS